MLVRLNDMYWKRRHFKPYTFFMLILVVAASLLRFVLIYNNWPATNSDEGVMDLMALHIAYRGEHPIFYYGQYYMGPLEAYVGALLFHLIGASVFALRSGLILFFVLFLVSMFFLTRLLYNKQLALATVGLLSLGSIDIILHQLKAIGGYPETVLFGALIFLLVSHLTLTYQKNTSSRTPYKRYVIYFCLGLLMGLALWTDQLILPCLATSALLLFLFCRRELLKLSGLCLLSGGIIGALPLLYYNVTAPLAQNSITILFGLQHAGTDEIATRHIPAIQKLIGSLLYALPAITGANPLCDIQQLPLFGPTTVRTWQCSAFQGSWSLGYLILWGSAVFLATRVIWQIRKRQKQQKEVVPTFEERQGVIRECLRLMLLISAILTLVLYTLSPAAALFPGPTSRYLICMQIATPALLWPLWGDLQKLRLTATWKTRATYILRIVLLLYIEVTFLLGTVRTLNDIPNAQAFYKQENALIADLQRIGATRIYTDYWTCNRLIFQSNERIVCSTLDETLQPGMDRYPPYKEMVKEVIHPTYIFQADSVQAKTLERALPADHIVYRRYVFEGYIVYQTL